MHTPEERARLQQEILWLVAEGATATAACRLRGLPISTLQDWKRHDPEFLKEWRLARIEQAHCLADEIIDIADEPVAPGDMAAVQRNRLRVDTRKWFCGKQHRAATATSSRSTWKQNREACDCPPRA